MSSVMVLLAEELATLAWNVHIEKIARIDFCVRFAEGSIPISFHYCTGHFLSSCPLGFEMLCLLRPVRLGVLGDRGAGAR